MLVIITHKIKASYQQGERLYLAIGVMKLAKKHFDEYYNIISQQLFDLQTVFDDLQQEVNQGMVPPERLENVQRTIQPIKDTYQCLSYVKYLLNKPTRKSKQPTYARQNKKLLATSGDKSGDKVITQNKELIKSLRK